MHVQYCIQSTLTLILKVRYLTVSTVPYGMAQVCHIRYDICICICLAYLPYSLSAVFVRDAAGYIIGA